MAPSERPGPSGPDILERSPRRWPGRRARWLPLAIAALALAGGAVALVVHHGRHRATRPGRPVVPAVYAPGVCGQYVNLTSSAVSRGFRIVLGDVAVPPGRLPRLGPSGHASWPYGLKTAFQFRGDGPPVTISVPQRWQDRVALFGPPDEPHYVARTVRLPSCPPRGAWDTYVSSFYAHSATACVPLQVQVRHQTATVWFGLGRRCRPRAGAALGRR